MPSVAHLAETSPPWVELLVVAGGRMPDGLDRRLPGFAVRRLDGRRCGTKPALLAELARVLAFPAHFGRNWDALEDCLTDLEWLPAPGYLLVVTQADRLLAGRPADYRTFVSILESAGAEWAAARTGVTARAPRPFHTLLAVDASRVAARRSWRVPVRPDDGGEERA